MNTKVRPAVLIFAVGALAFSLGYVAFDHDESMHGQAGSGSYADLVPDPGARAAGFTLATLDGETVTEADYEGKIMVLDFWATWCAPCLTEIPAYNALHADYAGEDVEMLGVTFQSGSSEQVREWLSQPVKLGADEVFIEYPIVMGNDEVESTWGPIYGFPLTYLVDHQWRIRKRWIGAIPDKSEQLRHLIDILIEERAADRGEATDD